MNLEQVKQAFFKVNSDLTELRLKKKWEEMITLLPKEVAPRGCHDCKYGKNYGDILVCTGSGKVKLPTEICEEHK